MRRLLPLLLLAALVGCAGPGSPDRPGSAPAATAAAGPRDARVRYVVVPHPDDEFAAWSLIADDPAHYTVFLVLTRGEAGGACDGGGLQAAAGERVPLPQPFTGKRSPNCRAQRLDAFWAFLAGMARTDRHLDVPERVAERNGYELFVGDRTAALVFDFGDGRVTPAEVVSAVRSARAERPAYRVQEEDDVVGAAYFNDSDPRWYQYRHRDQQAVQEALWSTDLGTPGPQVVRTWPDDPRRAFTRRVPEAAYQAAMAVSPGPADPVVNPDARRVGAQQTAYGWLAFTGAYWPEEDKPRRFFFSRSQDFWSRY